MKRYRVSELVSVALPASAAVMLVSGVLLWRADWLAGWLVPWLQGACLTAFAVLGAASVAAASCMAGHAQAAIVHGKRFRSVYWPAILFGLGYAMAGAIGVHIGWEVLTKPSMADMHLPASEVVVAASLFLALGKPVFAFVLEGRKQVDAFEVAEEDKAREAAALAREEAQDRAQGRRFTVVGGIGAVGAAAALLGAPMDTPAPSPYPTHDVAQEPAERPQSAVLDTRSFSPKDRAKFEEFKQAIARYPISQAIHKVGVPRSTGYHWAKLIGETQAA